jgi:hypothetical protein
MTRFSCLDGDHDVAPDVHLPVDGDAARVTALVDLGWCPACPDTRLTAGRGSVQICPCCWSVWWRENGAVRCTPGAIVVDEPAPPTRHRTA